MNLRFCIFSLLAGLFWSVYGQSPLANWQAINSNQLSNTYITALAEDEDGFLWIGTQKGLNRYNGSTYRIYYSQDSLSLTSDNIMSLYADSHRRLWVGTDAGINLIQNGKVTRRSKLKVDFIFSMDSYSEDYLLFSNYQGLALYDKRTGDIKDSIVTNLDIALSRHVCCTKQNIYATVFSKPIVHVFDRDFHYQGIIRIPKSSSINGLTAVSSLLYISTDQGLFCYSATNGFSQQAIPPALDSLSRNANVLFFHVGKQGQVVYVGIAGKGIFSYNLMTGQLLQLTEHDTLENVHSSISLLTSESIWLSKDKNPPTMYSLHYLRNAIVFNLNQGENIIRILAYDKGKILLACTSKHIYTYNTKNQLITNITPRDFTTIQTIKGVIVDSEQAIWLLINSDIIKKYVLIDGKMQLVKEIPVDQALDIMLNNKGGIYLLQEDKITELDAMGKVEEIYPIPPSITSRIFMQTNKGNIYFLDYDSVYRFSQEAQFLKMPLNVVLPYCFYESNDSKLWIGTFKSGLYCYDKASKHMLHFSTENGLPDNTIRAIQGDSQNNIWVSMRNQISKITPNEQYITTYMEDNVINAFYSGNCTAQDAEGNLYFAGNNFMTCIPTDSKLYVAENIPLYLDAIVVDNKLLNDSIDALTLGYDEKQVAIYYSALDFNPNIRLNYSYLLEGYNQDWVYAGQSQYVIFSNLPSGSYRLRVRVQNPSGEWNANELVLPIHILSHPLLTPLAKSLYAIGGILLILFVARLFIKQKIEKERQLLTETEKVMNEQLKQDKIDFFINISHEFRTPLSLIYAPAKELMEKSTMPTAERRLLTTIENNAERMLHLTEQLLNFDKVDFKGKQLAVRENDLTLQVNTAIENIRFLAERQGISLTKQVPESFPAYCDIEKIEKVLYNLLSNAIKYTPSKGHITVQIKELSATQAHDLYRKLPIIESYDGMYAEIVVNDTGPGISTEQVDKLFRRYERFVENEKDSPIGFGIGLNYAMQLAVIHKGSLRVTSKVGKGSCFYFAFPIQKGAYSQDEVWIEKTNAVPESSATQPEKEGSTFDPNKTTILLVEDDIDMRNYLHGLFVPEYNVLPTQNGVEAMERLQIAVPDIILSDIMMPYKNGLALCNEIKNNPEYCHLPIILLTAKTESDTLLKGLDYGADAYIRKPFDPKYLLVVIRNLLANRKRLQSFISNMTTPLQPEISEELDINPRDKDFLNKLYQLTDRFLNNEDFNIASIASELDISRSSFYSKIKALTGQSPQQFLGTYRLNKAMELLQTRQYTVSEVCYKVGFGSVSGFSRSFKKQFGIAPSDVGK